MPHANNLVFCSAFSGNEELRKSKQKSFGHHHDNSKQKSLVSIMTKK
jgi:hypothetical protein